MSTSAGFALARRVADTASWTLAKGRKGVGSVATNVGFPSGLVLVHIPTIYLTNSGILVRSAIRVVPDHTWHSCREKVCGCSKYLLVAEHLGKRRHRRERRTTVRTTPIIVIQELGHSQIQERNVIARRAERRTRADGHIVLAHVILRNVVVRAD